MSRSFVELPQDVLLELLKHLDVEDLINFLSLCRVIRELQLQKSLWLYALVRVREVQMQPLPLPAAASLDTLSLQELLDTLSLQKLQHTALQVNQIMKNLKSENPRPVRIRTLSVERERRLFCIPAANLAVTHGLGIVDCWDLLTCQRVAHMEIRMFLYIVTWPCLEEEGKAIFGAAIGWGTPEHLVAICIDYRDRANLSISHLISPAVQGEYSYNIHFFITTQVVGFVARSSIVSWRMDNPNNGVVKTPVDIPSIRLINFHVGT
ncbi:hypothetical protein C8F04DRAFT_1310705 [Mycena alexandri]|uniref:F-box domain-containing protein n=1 Tax=Mycena alexandri TaxID=1745969 RepID=A0AAD6WRI4_9AGAR|nr:hypothetical protein C8F04DRAFT_1310705 [Mycena alexandri]